MSFQSSVLAHRDIAGSTSYHCHIGVSVNGVHCPRFRSLMASRSLSMEVFIDREGKSRLLTRIVDMRCFPLTFRDYTLVMS